VRSFKIEDEQTTDLTDTISLILIN